jgi:hypothetical protein
MELGVNNDFDSSGYEVKLVEMGMSCQIKIREMLNKKDRSFFEISKVTRFSGF